MGKSLIWDSTCVDTLAPSHLPLSAKQACSAANSAVRNKHRKYKHLTDNYIFKAVAIETLGPWSSEAKHLISDIGNRLNAITGDTRCLHYLRQRIGLAVQRGNVISILGSFPEDISLEEIFLL